MHVHVHVIMFMYTATYMYIIICLEAFGHQSKFNVKDVSCIYNRMFLGTGRFLSTTIPM